MKKENQSIEDVVKFLRRVVKRFNKPGTDYYPTGYMDGSLTDRKQLNLFVSDLDINNIEEFLKSHELGSYN